MISLASTCLNWLAKSSRTEPRSSPVPNRFKNPFNCSTRSLSGTAPATFTSKFVSATGSDSLVGPGSLVVSTLSVSTGAASSTALPCRLGISPSNVKPAFIKAPTISSIDTPFILAPFGMVMILPTEFNITLFVISLKPKPFIISMTSGYS